METKEYKSGCDINLKAYNSDCAGNSIPDRAESKEKANTRLLNSKEEREATALSMGITVAKLTAMREYANSLVKHDKKMKPATVRKRVAEKFKIKLA